MSNWEFERGELLGKLKLVAPALAKKGAAMAAPQFEQLWFTDFGVFACNDQIAIVTTLGDDSFVGGVHGERLIKLLASSSADDVVFSDDGDGRLVVESGFRAKLLTDYDDPPFVWPQPDEESVPIIVDDTFLAATKLAHAIVDTQSYSRQSRGMTIAQSGNGVALFFTDRNSMVRVRLDQPWGDREQVILTMPFVEAIARLGEGELALADDYALFTCGETMLWGRYILPEPDLLNYEGEVAKRMPPDFTLLPPGFKAAIVRAGIMAAPDEKRVPIKMVTSGGVMTLSGAGVSGEVVDELAPFNHAPITLRFNQRLVERIGGHGLTQLGLTAETLVFTSDDERIDYLISAH